MTFFYNLDEFTKVSRPANELDNFSKIRLLSGISQRRDKYFEVFHKLMTDTFDDAEGLRKDRFREIIRKIHSDDKCMKIMRLYVKYETLLQILKRPKEFQSKEIQQYFLT